MEKNQSEQSFYLSSLKSSSIISSAQFPCNVIGSNKNNIHTIVPNSNSSLNFNTKYQNTTNDFKIAQNLTNSNVCYTNMNNQSDEYKYLLSNKTKKQYVKRNLNMKTPSQCLNSNDNSSDITAAPNQLTILVQEVLPAQVPDNPILTTTIPSHINSIHLSNKAHSSNIISSGSQVNEKLDSSIKLELSSEPKKELGLFSPVANDSDIIHTPTPAIITQANLLSETKDTISEVIKEVLMKALSSDPHEDVFLSVIKSRENASRPSFLETVDSGIDVSNSMSSPTVSQFSDNTLIQSSGMNSIPYPRHQDQLIQQCRLNKQNFIHPQFLSQNEHQMKSNDLFKPNLLSAQSSSSPSFSKSDFYSTNCQIIQHPQSQQKLPINPSDESPHLLTGPEPNSKQAIKRRNPSTSKASSKKPKLFEPVYPPVHHGAPGPPNYDKSTIPMQRYQQSIAKQLGVPNFRKLVHEPRIKHPITVLTPLGCKPRSSQCTDVSQLQDNCVKYKRVPFTMPQLNPIHLPGTTHSCENSFIIQNINAAIPEGGLLSTHESDDIDCLIAPSPSNNELDYLSAFNCDPISSPSVSLSGGPNLEMLYPSHRTQSPQLSVFHCPNKDYLKFDQSNFLSAPSVSSSSMSAAGRKADGHSLFRPTGISRVQISQHKYSSSMLPGNETGIDGGSGVVLDNDVRTALIDSETGEVVSKPDLKLVPPLPVPREKLLMTFTINPPDDVEKTVRNITDVLGIDYSSVEFKETTRGGELAIDKDTISSHSIPREICERYNTAIQSSQIRSTEPSGARVPVPISISTTAAGSVDNFISLSRSSSTPQPLSSSSNTTVANDNPSKPELPLYSEKVYKSSALLASRSLGPVIGKCANCDSHCEQRSSGAVSKYREASFCDPQCQHEYSMMMLDDDQAVKCGSGSVPETVVVRAPPDQCIFIGDQLHSNCSVIVQGSISKSKHISKRLGALINDKLLKKKASLATAQLGGISSGTGALGMATKSGLSSSSSVSSVALSYKPPVHRGTRYRLFHHTPSVTTGTATGSNSSGSGSGVSLTSSPIHNQQQQHQQQHISTISHSQFQQLSLMSRSVLRAHSGVFDRRRCVLCRRAGDLPDNGPGRLIPVDIDRYLHVNCSLWCHNVFEMQCGSLNNVTESLQATQHARCTGCGQRGAGIGCYYPRCSSKYHVPCAQDKQCVFLSDRAMYCPVHQQHARDLGPQLTSLNVDRRVYIARDELCQIVRAINAVSQDDDDEDSINDAVGNDNRSHSISEHISDTDSDPTRPAGGGTSYVLRIGSLMVLSIGQLLPHQIHSGHFHNMNHVYPTGYRSRRVHWSSRVKNVRSVYECAIDVNADDKPVFKVTATDYGLDDEVHESACCADSWRPILDRIARLRRDTTRSVKLFPEHLKSEDLFGLTEPYVLRAIESLPGLETVHDYAFKFGKMQLIPEMPLPINATGSVRTEPFVRLSSGAAARHRPSIHQSPVNRNLLTTSTTGPGSLTSRWQQYRKLKQETKSNVVLKRSKIQGFGLYAARDIDKGTMIIEYVGQLIRNEVANIREKQYEARKQGVYMFRLDPSTVIDATRAGDVARYINHCCEPNCVTESLDFEKESHIVIIASRRIDKGEELTYDYKFDLDDSSDDKIPCLCGARSCRRWMN